MKKITLLLFLFMFTLSNAQDQGRFWYFGEFAGLDFNTSPPTALNNGALSSLEGCSSISDDLGNLLMYSDGTTIWNRNHQAMPNGLGLSGTTTSAQSALIIPDIQIDDIYFVVTIGSGAGLHYSIVNMNLDNGLGDVIPGRKNILIQQNTSEKIAVTLNDTDDGYWIVTFDDPTYTSYRAGGGLIAANNPVSSTIAQTSILTDHRGILKISPDGTKLINTSVSGSNIAYLTSFDNTTGVVSNPIPLSSSTGYNNFYGAEFSPNSNLVYLQANTINPGNGCGTNNTRQILQYNMFGTAGWYFSPLEIAGANGFSGSRAALQLAPDGKIYAARSCEQWLGVIQNPNQLGNNTNYVHDGVALATGTLSREGLPNHLSSNYSVVDNQINGNVLLDSDLNGCNSIDIGYENLLINIQSLSFSAFGVALNNGFYEINLPDENYTITPQLENPTYWNVSPATATVDFPLQPSPHTQDFCVTANGVVEDLEVFVLPLEQARPGFDTDYLVKIKNKGNQMASGTVTLDYEEDFMTLLSSTPVASQPATNQLSWSFSNLQPFQMEEYEFTMTLNTPTDPSFPLNGGDVLTYTGTVTGQGTDATPADNTMVFDQMVVNSYDPNDKTCLEGETIDPADVGEYVHYMIRFENTGTASAVNVVVKDEIDINQFDITTLVPLGGSHDYYVRIKEGNVVEFIHEDINLDFNDATNDGHVLFKIKTLSTLNDGDTFDNTAQIYFDFNAPIVTNTETVTVMSTASVGQVTDSSISVYPNPTSGVLNITGNHSISSITIYDLNGRLLSKYHFTDDALDQQIEVSALGTGIYFMNIESSTGSATHKVVVE